MLPARIDNILPNHIQSLVLNKVHERKRLEYKERLPEGSDKAKKEFLADVCSFANSAGGDIIYGIRDARDAGNQPTGIPESISGLPDQNLGAACQRLESLLRDGISPRIPKVESKPIEVQAGVWVVLLRVHRSWIKPHMVTYAGTSRFFARNSNGKFQLDVQEIGQAFAEQQSLGEQLQNWRANRIAKQLSDDGPVPLKGPSKLLFHFIPASGLVGPTPIIGWRMAEEHKVVARPSNQLSSFSTRYNADGFLVYSVNGTETCHSYVQIFHNGALEYGDGYILNTGDRSAGDMRIPSKAFEQKVIELFKNGLLVLDSLGVDDPVYVCFALVNVEGLTLSRGQRSPLLDPPSFDRQVINTPELQILDRSQQMPFRDSLLPLVNHVWQANGYERSPWASAEGDWRPFD